MCCYIGKIKLYMYQMDPSFYLDLIVRVVAVAEAASAASSYTKRCELNVKLLQ